MAQAGSARNPRRLVHIAVAVTAAWAGASGATAAEPKAVDGLLQFANVRVVNAPPSGATPAPQGGLRAYKDSADGELRGPTTEELQAAAAASKPTLRSASDRDAAADNELPTFAAAGGGVGVVLDESSMQYSVVVRQADGSLKEVCVTGPEAAEAVLKKPSATRTAAKETRNVR